MNESAVRRDGSTAGGTPAAGGTAERVAVAGTRTAPGVATEGTGPTPRVAVVGAGTMGRGIAQLALQAGCSVVLIESNPHAAESAMAALSDLFESLAAKGRLDRPPSDVLALLSLAHDVSEAGDADWVIEAVPEDLALKRALFEELAVVAPRARLATNTSTLSVTAIAAGCSRAADVIGLHFFNPPGLMRLVEVVPGAETRPDLVDEAVTLVRRLARQPVVTNDSPGFIVNRLARPYYLEALRLHAEGVPVATCDAALRAAGFAMGPFELLDLIGLDVNLAASESVYQAFYQEPRYRPHPLQRRMVEAGMLGRKAGRGFYRYDESGRRLDDELAPGATPSETHAVGAATGSSSVVAETFTVLGDGPVAQLLRAHLPTVAEGTADFVLDTDVLRTSPAETVAVHDSRLLVLAWGHSASVATAAMQKTPGTSSDRPVLGFSLVPGGRPREEGLSIELLVPDSPSAAAAAASTAAALAAAGVTVLLTPDQPGGIAFRVVGLLINEAVSALAEGLASKESLDTAMRLGVNYPQGPLEWAERLGLANVLEALDSLHRETGAERFAPHPLLRRLVATGRTTFTQVSAVEVPPTTTLSDSMER